MTPHHIKNSMLRFKQVKNVPFLQRAYSDAAAALKGILCEELKNLKDCNEWKTEHMLTSSQKVQVSIEGQKCPVLNFSSSNYLGFASHSEIVCATKTALDSFGAGMAAVRFTSGTNCLHKDLEAKIAKFHCRESAVLYANCYLANAGFFEAVLRDKDAVFFDELCHPSIIDGIRLCCAQKFCFRHNCVSDLEQNMKKVQCARLKVIVTCGVFPSDADMAPLPEICKVAQKNCAMMYIDDSHGTGVIGKTGRGSEELFGMMGVADVITSTLGNALGGAAGGYTTGPQELTCYLRQTCKTYIYTNSVSPPSLATGIKALELLANDSSLLCRLQKNTEKFRCAMTQAGFTISGQNHPICPIMLCDAKIAHQMAADLLCKGLLATPITSPIVPKDKPRIRVQISAEHCDEDIDKAICIFTEVGKNLNIIK